MRIIHTADWHLGRTLEGRSRMPEHIAFFNELDSIIQDVNADVLLMAGDVFDSVNPPASAEELFYETMASLTEKYGISAVIIAGNHDHPERLAAARTFTKNQGVHIIGHPGLHPVCIKGKEEVLQIAALPYPSESRMKSVFSELPEEKRIRDAYNKKIKYVFEQLSTSFDPAHICMAMSHLFVAGGTASDSERPIEVGGAYTVTADSLPKNAQYTALGHLHRPQNIQSASSYARYSGSPLAFSFSEAGYSNSVTCIDIHANETPRIEEIPLSSGKPLVRWKAKHGMNEVLKWIDEKKDANAWIDLELHLDETPSLEEIHRLRLSHEGIINIRPVFPELQEDLVVQEKKELPIDELFKKYYHKQTGREVEERLVHLFMDIVQEGEEN